MANGIKDKTYITTFSLFCKISDLLNQVHPCFYTTLQPHTPWTRCPMMRMSLALSDSRRSVSPSPVTSWPPHSLLPLGQRYNRYNFSLLNICPYLIIPLCSHSVSDRSPMQVYSFHILEQPQFCNFCVWKLVLFGRN